MSVKNCLLCELCGLDDCPLWTCEAFNAWHELMESYGWRPVRDVFGMIVQYEFKTPARVLVLHAAHFAQWANLMDTPPPF